MFFIDGLQVGSAHTFQLAGRPGAAYIPNTVDVFLEDFVELTAGPHEIEVRVRELPFAPHATGAYVQLGFIGSHTVVELHNKGFGRNYQAKCQ